MDIFDKIASEYIKEARIPSAGNIKRVTDPKKPWHKTKNNCLPRTKENCGVWTKEEVDKKYEEWKNQKNIGDGLWTWQKYEGAMSPGSQGLSQERINKNLQEIEGFANKKENQFTVGDKVNRFFGKKKKVEDFTKLNRGIGGDGDPRKKKKRQELKEKKEMKKQNKKASAIRVASLYLQGMGKEAGWAGGSYGGTLSPVTTEPGEGYKIVRSGGTLHGWDKYVQLVAEHYASLPSYTSEGEKSFVALKGHIITMFQRQNSKIDVVFVDYDPYSSAEEMREDVLKNNVLKITELYNQDAWFGPDVNLMLRAVHDFQAHLGANPKNKPKSFGMKGELQAYNKHMNLVGKTSKAVPALFIEIIGQAAHFWYYGEFPDQKIASMGDKFDMVRLGNVKGYEIIDGDLVKV